MGVGSLEDVSLAVWLGDPRCRTDTPAPGCISPLSPTHIPEFSVYDANYYPLRVYSGGLDGSGVSREWVISTRTPMYLVADVPWDGMGLYHSYALHRWRFDRGLSVDAELFPPRLPRDPASLPPVHIYPSLHLLSPTDSRVFGSRVDLEIGRCIHMGVSCCVFAYNWCLLLCVYSVYMCM